jgi:3-oxoacyl-[acyl-carrier protein] reductase
MDTKIALVTGAGQGIGRAIAARLAADGAHVVVNDLDPTRAGKTAADVGGEAAVFDVTDSATFDSVVDEIVATHGRLDILVNNAGILGLPADVIHRMAAASTARQAGEEVPPAEVLTMLDDVTFDRMLKVHLYGTFHGMRAALRHMQPARRGAIVNIASIAALRPFPSTPHYAAAKAAVVALTRSVAFEVAPLGIRINAVAPGFVDTSLLAVDGDPGLTAVVQQLLPTRIGAGRLGTPEEIAAAVAFLASDDASFCFGEVLSVTGADLGD